MAEQHPKVEALKNAAEAQNANPAPTTPGRPATVPPAPPNPASRPTTNPEAPTGPTATRNTDPVKAVEGEEPRSRFTDEQRAQLPKDTPQHVKGVFLGASIPANASLAELQSIYASMRDGDYLSAFKRSVSFLNTIFNPATGATAGVRRAMTAGRSLSTEEAVAYEKVLYDLENMTTKANRLGMSMDEAIPPSENPSSRRRENAMFENTEISFGSLMSLIQVIVSIFKQFSNR